MPATPPPPPPPPPPAAFAGDDISSVSSPTPRLFQQAAHHQESELRRVPSTNFPPPSLPPHSSAAVAAIGLDSLSGPSTTHLSNNIPTPAPSAAQTPITYNGRTFYNLPSHVAAQLQVVNQPPKLSSWKEEDIAQ
jgi:hypothetical protein